MPANIVVSLHKLAASSRTEYGSLWYFVRCFEVEPVCTCGYSDRVRRSTIDKTGFPGIGIRKWTFGKTLSLESRQIIETHPRISPRTSLSSDNVNRDRRNFDESKHSSDLTLKTEYLFD